MTVNWENLLPLPLVPPQEQLIPKNGQVSHH